MITIGKQEAAVPGISIPEHTYVFADIRARAQVSASRGRARGYDASESEHKIVRAGRKIFDNGHRLRKTSFPTWLAFAENRAIESLMWKRASGEKGMTKKKQEKEKKERGGGGGGNGSGTQASV